MRAATTASPPPSPCSCPNDTPRHASPTQHAWAGSLGTQLDHLVSLVSRVVCEYSTVARIRCVGFGGIGGGLQTVRGSASVLFHIAPHNSTPQHAHDDTSSSQELQVSSCPRSLCCPPSLLTARLAASLPSELPAGGGPTELADHPATSAVSVWPHERGTAHRSHGVRPAGC